MDCTMKATTKSEILFYILMKGYVYYYLCNVHNICSGSSRLFYVWCIQRFGWNMHVMTGEYNGKKYSNAQ